MRYLSVCSGIEAASVAWRPLGWTPAAFAEIEPFPCAVLEQRHPGVPNLGDITQIREIDLEMLGSPVGLLVGGTPCQSFSVAGNRRGLADPRGDLALAFARIAAVLRPKWVVWENVPGVLSSGRGWDFAAFVRSLVDLGYGVAWRVLDAQYFGVPQRRRRVFVVGCLGGVWGPGQVLLEPPCGRGNPAARKEEAAPDPRTCPQHAEGDRIFGTLTDSAARAPRYASQIVFGGGATVPRTVAPTLTAHRSPRYFDCEAFVLNTQQDPITLAGRSLPLGAKDRGHAVSDGGSLRRLMPVECERLQGFPDNYTRIEWRGRPPAQCPDGHRYRAIGNSMPVPVMRWIGERIGAVELL